LPEVWCKVKILPDTDLRYPLAPEFLPSIKAGELIDNAWFRVISVSVWIS
jgi:hypothetical protein